MKFALKILLSLTLFFQPFALGSLQCGSDGYREIQGFLCIRGKFTRTLSNVSCLLQCAFACEKEPRCRAFTTADGPCQLFVFDACSKAVKDCSCSRWGRIFVKRQPGLEPGRLCPNGYGHDLCGVKYRVIADKAGWAVQRARCESDAGLTIMADVSNRTEMDHINSLYTLLLYSVTPGEGVFLGGFYTSDSTGWQWVSCRLPITDGFWGLSEPSKLSEKSMTLWPSIVGLADVSDTSSLFALCECLSPFD